MADESAAEPLLTLWDLSPTLLGLLRPVASVGKVKGVSKDSEMSAEAARLESGLSVDRPAVLEPGGAGEVVPGGGGVLLLSGSGLMVGEVGFITELRGAVLDRALL